MLNRKHIELCYSAIPDESNPLPYHKFFIHGSSKSISVNSAVTAANLATTFEDLGPAWSVFARLVLILAYRNHHAKS